MPSERPLAEKALAAAPHSCYNPVHPVSELAPQRSEAKLPLRETLAYGAGGMSNQIFDSGIQYIVLQVFNLTLGVNPFLVGLAQSIARGADLFTDPLAGYLVDAERHRIPLQRYLWMGAVGGGAAFAAIWLFPLGLSPGAYFAWLLIGFTLTSIAWSFVSVPRGALGIEMTSEPYERAKLMTIAGFMAIACNFCLCWAFAATQLPIFGGTIGGARWVGSAMGLGIAVFGVLMAVGCQAAKQLAPSPTRRASWSDFFAATRRVLRCRPFALLATAYALIQVGLIAVDTGILPCIVIYHVGSGSQARGAVLLGSVATAWLVSALSISAPVLWLSERWGKKNALLFFLALTFVGSSLRWLCYDPHLPYLMLVPFALYGCGTGAFFILAPAMTADTCDWEEAQSGYSDSGMFSAAFNWLNKLGTALGALASGALINLTGFHAGFTGSLPAATLWRMKLIDTAVPTTGLLIGIILLLRYPLTAARMTEVRAARRRAA